MGVFLSIYSKKRDCEKYITEDKLNQYDARLHIDWQHRSYVKSTDSSCAFIHFSRRNVFSTAKEQSFVSVNKNKLELTYLQGHIWGKKSGAKALTAEDLAKALKRGNTEVLRDAHHGEYSIVHYSEKNKTLTIFNDRLSMELVYYCQAGDAVFISNRISLINEARASFEPDVESLIWMVGLSSIIGEGTSDKYVKRLPQGGSIEIKNGDFVLNRPPLFMLESNQSNSVKKPTKIFSWLTSKRSDDIFSDVIEGSIEDCVNNLETALSYGSKRISLPLTGGKDSRAVLALMLRFVDKRLIDSFTWGVKGHADATVAEKISKHYRLSHELNKRKPPSEFSDDWVFNKLFGHVFQTEGMLSAWYAKGVKSYNKALLLKGMLGEVYRSPYNKSKYDISSPQDFSKQYLQLFDSADLLNDSSYHHFENLLLKRLDYYLDNGAELSDLPDLTYLVERIPNCVSVIKRVNAYSTNTFNPLYNEELLKLAYRLGSEQRRTERIHFEIINRYDSWLAAAPFAEDMWHKEIQAHASVQLANDQVTTTQGISIDGNWQLTLKRSQSFRNELLDIITAYPNSPIWDYCDRKKVENKFKTGDFKSFPKLLNAYGFIGSFLYVHRLGQPCKVACQD